jgi:hypothetical protein
MADQPKQPCGEELTREEHRANQAFTQRRLRIEHVNSSVKRCRIVKDRIRLWKQGIRDLVMERCCALHTFRVRLTPWQPMVAQFLAVCRRSQVGSMGTRWPRRGSRLCRR